MTAYRIDVDGLRSFAILPVVAFHYGVTAVKGGFVGVDVFFVISGFLITSQIKQWIEAGEFSLWTFYSRRFKRIFPALLLVICFTLLIGYFSLLPDAYASLGSQSAYAAGGLANFWFLWQAGDYFAAASDLQPMLHTWSLGVEEQFYVFWPIALFSLYLLPGTKRRNVAVAIAVIITLSFAASIYWTGQNRSVAFFMLHTRAWELALGAGLCFVPAISSRGFAEGASVMGLAAIIWSIFAIEATSGFPGYIAAVPCLGAALVIWPKTIQTYTARFLSLTPLVWVGLLSYSFYLWHWPPLALWRLATGETNLSTSVTLSLLSLAAGFAIASYYCVEKPLRRVQWRPSIVVASAVSVAAIIAAAGLQIYRLDGLPGRLPAAVQNILLEKKFNTGLHYRSGTCFLTSIQLPADFNVDRCMPDDAEMVLWGDSYAAHYYEAVAAIPGKGVQQANHSGCPPILEFAVADRPGCVEFNNLVFDRIVKTRPKIAVLTGAWWRYRFDFKMLDATLAKLEAAGVKTLVVNAGPVYRGDLPDLLAKRMLTGSKSTVARTSDARATTEEARMKFQEHFKSQPGYIDLVGETCIGGCQMVVNGHPTHWDYGHYTTAGTLHYGKPIVRRLNEAFAR